MTRLRTVSAASAPTAYDVLGCAPGVTLEALKSAYYALAQKTHPDKNGAGFEEIGLAWSRLKTPALRADYDRRLKLEGRLNCAPCKGTGLRRTFKGGAYREITCDACTGKGHS